VKWGPLSSTCAEFLSPTPLGAKGRVDDLSRKRTGSFSRWADPALNPCEKLPPPTPTVATVRQRGRRRSLPTFYPASPIDRNSLGFAGNSLVEQAPPPSRARNRHGGHAKALCGGNQTACGPPGCKTGSGTFLKGWFSMFQRPGGNKPISLLDAQPRVGGCRSIRRDGSPSWSTDETPKRIGHEAP